MPSFSSKDAITNIHKPDDIKETEYNSNSYIRLAYDELLAMEGQIRKQRQETVYKQQQMRRRISLWARESLR